MTSPTSSEHMSEMDDYVDDAPLRSVGGTPKKTLRSNSAVPLEVSRRVYTQQRFDDDFSFIEAKSEFWPKMQKTAKKQVTCNVARVQAAIPLFEWLPRYNLKKDLIQDLVAGLTIAVMHIPQGMAYATLAGLAPVYGLYTSFYPSLIYAILGTSMHCSIGTFAVVSLMIGNAISPMMVGIGDGVVNGTALEMANAANIANERIVDLSVTLTFVVGLMQVMMGILRLGFVTAYLSDQLIAGFTTGAAVHVFTSQVNSVLNVARPSHRGSFSLFFVYIDLFTSVIRGEFSYVTLIMSAATIIILLIGKEILQPHIKRLLKVPMPFEIVVVVIGTVVSYMMELNKVYGVSIVDEVPIGLPPPRLPVPELAPAMIGDAVGIAVVAFVLTLSVGKLFAKQHGYRLDASQEPYAYGITNMVTALGSGYVACASLSRSVVLSSLQPATNMATVITSITLLIVIFFLGPVFEHLPMCVLASIILVALKGLFMQFGQLGKLWRLSKIDLSIWIVSFTVTVCLGVREGLIVSLVYALFTTVLRAQRPPSMLLGRLPNTDIYRSVHRYAHITKVPRTCIFRFDAPLMFINTELFRKKLYQECEIDLADAREIVNEAYRRRMSMRAPTMRSAELPEVTITDPANTALNGGTLGKQESRLDMSGWVTVGLLYFGYCSVSHASIAAALRSQLPAFIVIDCSTFNYIDTSGIDTLSEIYAEMAEIHVQVLFAGFKGPVRDQLAASTFHEQVPASQLYPTLHDAVTYAQSTLVESALVSARDSTS